jgi:hypothetical protein
VSRLLGAVSSAAGAAAAVAECARRQGVEATAVLELQPRGASPGSDPGLVLIHATTTPHQRTGLLQALSEELPASTPQVLALSEPEWPLWRDTSGLALPLPLSARWGTLPPAGAPASATQVRTATLRRAAGLYVDDLPQQLSSDASREEVASLGASLRDLLAEVAVPARFPPLPPSSASAQEQVAAAIGVFHAALGGEAEGVVPGAGADGGVAPEAGADEAAAFPPLRTATAARQLVAPLLADLPRPIEEQLRALYLLPGPWGTRHRWRLCAVLPGDAPLLQAAGLRRHLQQHLRMLPARDRAAILGQDERLFVVTEDALAGLLTRRLFQRPLFGLSIRAHRQLLLGEDVVGQLPLGDEYCSEGDIRAEVAGLLAETGSCWRDLPPSLAVRDLLFGAWPAVLHLARGGAASDSLSAVHESLCVSTDSALSRVGSAASSQAWGDPSYVDLSRSRELLRQWGPCLLRLQEATVEALE